MKPKKLFESFYNQISKAYLVNRPSYISALFKAAGSTHEIAINKSIYADSDYRYKICNGSKPISIDIKRSFPDDTVNVDALASYFAGYINMDSARHCRTLMGCFDINLDCVQNVDALSKALARQFELFITEKEKIGVEDIVAVTYMELLDYKKITPPKDEGVAKDDVAGVCHKITDHVVRFSSCENANESLGQGSDIGDTKQYTANNSSDDVIDTDPKRITVNNYGTVENQKFISIETMNGDITL